jgi:hypothetical protein
VICKNEPICDFVRNKAVFRPFFSTGRQAPVS